MEIWKDIPKTNGRIQVSSKGRARSLLRGESRILKWQPDQKGYLRLRVTVEQRKMTFKMHREVAKAFIPNPNVLPQVNHKDGDKTNNSVDNLEWCTNRENALHAIKNGLWENVFLASQLANESKRKPIVAYRDGVSRYYKSVSEAERDIGTKHISAVLKGKRTHAKGWKFRYAKGGDAECLP